VRQALEKENMQLRKNLAQAHDEIKKKDADVQAVKERASQDRSKLEQSKNERQRIQEKVQREKDNSRLMQTKWEKERQDLQRHSTHLEGEVSKRDQWLKKAKDIITECAARAPSPRTPSLPEHPPDRPLRVAQVPEEDHGASEPEPWLCPHPHAAAVSASDERGTCLNEDSARLICRRSHREVQGNPVRAPAHDWHSRPAPCTGQQHTHVWNIFAQGSVF